MQTGQDVAKEAVHSLVRLSMKIYFKITTQLTFTYSNSTIETHKRMCEICSKLTIKTPELCQQRCFGAFIFNFEHIFHLPLVFPLLTLNKSILAGKNATNLKTRNYSDIKAESQLI